MEVECRVYVEARLLIRLGSNMEEEEFPAGPQPGSNQIRYGVICSRCYSRQRQAEMTMDGDGSYFRENSLTELHFFTKGW